MVKLARKWFQPEQTSLLDAITTAIARQQFQLCEKSLAIGLDVDSQAARATCPGSVREALECIMNLAVARSPLKADIQITAYQAGQSIEIEIADCGENALGLSGNTFQPQDCRQLLGLPAARHGVDVFGTPCPQGGMAWTIVAKQRIASARAA